MRPATRIHALPKHGHERSEDAAHGPVASGGAARLAIADGATESAYAGDWARLLVRAACEAPLAEAVEAARAAFVEAAAGRSAALSWYAEAKAAEGAFATILALTIEEGGRWSAEAVGDCVLFQLRGGALHLAWPITDPAEFGDRPALIASGADHPIPDILQTKGEWRRGDAFLLATDALAAFLLQHDPLAAAGLEANQFAAFITDARQRGMRNDDVTLVEVRPR
jgi:hypothetical protein